ncbi:hypothetical protein ScPMuIL_008372 [Solemya velum]
MDFVYYYFMLLAVAATKTSAIANKETSSTTLVTALYDIGRGSWKLSPRSYGQYLEYFKRILSTNENMVIFVDEKDMDFVKNYRKQLNLDNKTDIRTPNVNTLEYFDYLQYITDILETDDFKENNKMLDKPWGFSPLYVALVNNKISFLNTATRANPFGSKSFFWIDASYGFGTDTPFTHENWNPEELQTISDKMIYAVSPDIKAYKILMNMMILHKREIPAAVNGGFFGGTVPAIAKYHQLYRKQFREALVENIVSNDEYFALSCINENPDVFYIVASS